MEQTTLTPAKCFVRDLANGQEVNSVFVVRAHSRRQKRNGESFLKLQLGDLTGAVEAVVWGGVDELGPVCPSGAVVRVLGRYTVDERYGATLTIRRMRTAEEHEYDLADLTEGPPVPYEQMAADLESLVATVQRPHLRELLARLVASGGETGRRYHEAPAAKYYHQAYRHGLLEHCLSVAQGVSALAATFPAIDRDVAVTGALLHDIGKVEAYASRNGAIELTDAGKLLGEIPSATTGSGARSRRSRASRPPIARRSCTSSSATTASSSTAAPSSRARARPRSCTSSTTSAATWAASTGSRSRSPRAPAGRTSTAASRRPRTSRCARTAGAEQAA